MIRLAGVDAALARGAIHYVALGDKHSVTEVGGSGRIWYSGAPEVTNYDDIEANPGHVLVVDIDEAHPQRPVTVDARHIGRWRFVTLHRQVDTNRDIADLDVNLDQMTDKDRTVVRLALTGSLTVTDRAALDACLDKYARLFAWLGMWERHTDLAVIPADGEFTDLGIGGFAASRRRRAGGDGTRGRRGSCRRCAGCAGAVAATRRSGGRMRLHRLVLTNYRGITHREIEFPDHGVVVVCGANEIGKSSMIEALDLLLESRDRSTKKEVKQVKPTDADVGSQVTAEISCGPYRFVYRKRFHKKCETELTVLQPRREQLTGDEAHERVRAMLSETVDNDLWRAQRVLQTGSTAMVNLSGCDALSRALDVAAAQSDTEAALSGAEPLLIDRIDAEYARYFTPTGRPTGEWAAAITRVSDAESAVAGCAAAVAEVDDRVRRHAALTEQVAELSQQRIAARPRLVAAEAAAEKIAALTGQAREAELVAAAAGATSAASTAAHAGRLRLRTEIDTRAATVAQAEAEAQEAAAAQLVAQADAEAADAAVDEAARVRAEVQRRTESARRTVEQLAARAEADRLAARLAKIDDIQRDRDRIGQELSVVVITGEQLQRIENAAAAVDRTGDQLASISAAVQFTAAADIELAVGDERVSLSAGQSWSITATGATEVEVPGVLTARITPGATALDVEAKHAAAQQELAATLAAADVADLQAARSADQRRRELHSGRDQLTATLAGLCGCDQIEDQTDQLRERLEQLQAGQPAGASALEALEP